jgi:plasmid stabilization system protein ParE
MARFRVYYSPRAQQDILAIHDYIAVRAGDGIASDYVLKLRTWCDRLDLFPYRGTARDDVRQGLRTMSYRRKATIAFVIGANEVVILSVIARGRDVEKVLRNV